MTLASETTSIAKATIAKEIKALEDTLQRIGLEYDTAVQLILKSHGKVIVTGLGKSGIIARKIAATLSSTGTPAVFIHPIEALHGDIGIVQSQDIGLALSKSGETQEILEFLQFMKRMAIKTIALTGNPHSSLAKHCDVIIDASVTSEACPLNLAPTSSTTVAMAIGDALAACLIVRRGFSNEDFAKRHPSGALGRRLLLRVVDAMHHGQDMPIVLTGTRIRDALVTMTQTAMGIILIVDAQGVLLGILTDGDLRRALQRYETLLDMQIDVVMTRNPIVIHPDRLAVEALSLMENRPSQISALPVVDENNTALGVLRLHDLVKAGL